MTREMISYEPKEVIELKSFIRFHPDLSWGQKVFMAEIESQSKTGKVYYHKPSLAKFFGVAQITIYEWIKDLAKKNLIEILFDPCDDVCKMYIVTKEKK